MPSPLPADWNGLPFLIYRLPGTREPVCRFYQQLSTAAEPPSESGWFGFFPFSGENNAGIYLSDWSESVPDAGAIRDYSNLRIRPQESTRAEAFEAFVRSSKQHFGSELQKTVAARITNYALHAPADPWQMAEEASQRYPDSCILVLNIPGAFTWFCCTPELLCRIENNRLETMSLAGTRPNAPGEPRWGDKELEEQDIVSRFLKETLMEMGGDIEAMDGPETYFTGSLYHLRTRFRVRIPEKLNDRAISRRLHPTPAVCGFPAPAAYRFIQAQEPFNRTYYAGYFGFRDTSKTEFFVNLRSGYLTGSRLTLFTGCGITSGSDAAAEWNETGIKRNTLLNLFKPYNPTEVQ